MRYKISHALVQFGGDVILRDVNFEVHDKEKIAIVGRNGCGKTTLLRLIAGDISMNNLDSDEECGITMAGKQEIGFLRQVNFTEKDVTVEEEIKKVFEPVFACEKRMRELENEMKTSADKQLLREYDNLQSRMEAMRGYSWQQDMETMFQRFGFALEDLKRPIGSFSGGQQTKVAFIKLLLKRPDIMLLDEPTNHLDIDAIAWLEGFLRDFKGAMIIISHDRYFLDNVTNKTIELEHNRAMVYKGSYSEFVKKKESVNESLKNKYEHDLKEIKRIEGIVEQQKRWGQAHNFITAASKQKEADRIKDELVAPESELETMRMHFEPRCESGNDVLICKNLAKSFDNKQLFKNVDIHIRKGERVFIIGGNGCGKKTLFRILTGKTPMNCGEYDYGANVEIGYFDQMQQNLDLSKTALDEVWDAFPNMTQTEVRSALASFLFKGDEVFKPLSKMSGGERARVSLLKLMLKGSNFLLLDEPTNHLDASSREELEKTLLDYRGTMLIVSHDRYFINKIADRILLLTNNGVKEYLGNYDYYLERTTAEKSGAVPTENKKDKKEKTQNDYFLQKQKQSEERKRQTKLKKAEAEIERLDEEIAKTQELLSSEEVAADYEKLMELSKLLEDLQKQQEEQYEIWEELESMAE